MWIGLNDGWLSIVKNLNDEKTLLVRARSEKHLLNVFPNCKHWVDFEADYPHRAYIDREIVMNVITQRIMDIDYPNFKNSVEEHTLVNAYHRVWETMANYYPGKLTHHSMIDSWIGAFNSKQITLDEFDTTSETGQPQPTLHRRHDPIE